MSIHFARYLALPAIFLAVQSSAHAGLLMEGVQTDGSGNVISDARWSFASDSGTLQANVDPLNGSANDSGDYPERLLLAGWGNGTSGGNFLLDSTLITDGGTQDLGSGTGVHVTSSFTGTGAIDVYARDGYHSDLDGFGGLGFRVVSGNVSSITVDIIFDYALSPRQLSDSGSAAGGGPQYGPLASIVGYISNGGTNTGTFDMRYELLGTSLETLNSGLSNPEFIDNNDDTFPFSTPTPAGSLTMWNTINSNGDTPMDYGSSFGIHNFNDGTIADDYIGGIRLTITADNGTNFAIDSQFNYSIDGTSPSGSPQIVPEPSTYMLLLPAIAGLFVRRRRRS